MPRSPAASAVVLVLAGCANGPAPAPPPAPLPPSTAAAPLVVTACPSVPSPPAVPEPESGKRLELVITPGISVGPIRIGMLRAEVEALGLLHRHPHFPGMTTPYEVHYGDDGRVARVLVSLLGAPGDVRVGKIVVPRGTRFGEAPRILGDCAKPDVGFGGGQFTCLGGSIEVVGGSGAPNELWIGTHAPADASRRAEVDAGNR